MSLNMLEDISHEEDNDIRQRVKRLEEYVIGDLLTRQSQQSAQLDFRAIDDAGVVRMIMSAISLFEEFGINAHFLGLDSNGEAQFWLSADNGKGTFGAGKITLGKEGLVLDTTSDDPLTAPLLKFINDNAPTGDHGMLSYYGNPARLIAGILDASYGPSGSGFGRVVKANDDTDPQIADYIGDGKTWGLFNVRQSDSVGEALIVAGYYPSTVGTVFHRRMGKAADDYTTRAGVMGLAGLKSNSNTSSGTAETVLATYTLPASALSADNAVALRITAIVEFTSGAGSKTGRIRFNGLTGTVIASKAYAGGAGEQLLEAILVRTGSSAERYFGKTIDGGGVNLTSGSAAIALSADIDIVVTGQTNVAAQTVKNPIMLVEFLPLDQP